MTQAAQRIIAEFEALSPQEQHEVAVEVLRRSAGEDELTDGTLDQLADELFLSCEAEESAQDASA